MSEQKLETVQEEKPEVRQNPEHSKPKTEPELKKQSTAAQIKFAMTKEASPPKITSQTEDEELKTNTKRKQVNKKLSTMSKNTKEKQKNKTLRKPTSTIPQGCLSKMLDINPMYLLVIIGVIIAM